MATKQSDESILLREVITEVLAGATEPLTNQEIHDDHRVRVLGLTADRVSRELSHMIRIAATKPKVSRVPSAKGLCKWAYFNPKVVKLAYAPSKPATPEPAASVNDVKSPAPEFHFDPVSFALAAPEVPAAPTVKSITVTVAGITVKIDITHQE